MGQNILLAGLGDHPAVITGMVKVLQEIEGISIDVLHVFHPQDTGKNIEKDALPLVLEHLPETTRLKPVPLGFTDANTTETSIQFLQIVASVLEQYKDPECYSVYMSLAGGRKNTSALMALVAQFYSSVRGLYHLLDREEDKSDTVFPSIEEIVLYQTPEQQEATFDPPLERLNLIRIPYPGAFSNSLELQRVLKGVATAEPSASVALTPEAEAFYRRVFDPGQAHPLLQVWLSKTAYEQYRAYAQEGSTYAQAFMTCFRQMQDPNRLSQQIHGTFGEFHFYKRRRTAERPFYYTRPNPIHLYPQQVVEEVIITGLSIEQGNGHYKPDENYWLAHDDHAPYHSLSALHPKKCTLLVPLGLSPMIATQTYQLLQESADEGSPSISTVAVIFPEQNRVIDNGVRLLKKQFVRRNVEFLTYPIRGVRDVDSIEACEQYLRDLLQAIEDVRRRNPERLISLTLSGGRKGMSALTIFAAQRSNIEKVYHTLITDIELETAVEQETSIESLAKLPTDEDRANLLFLEAYDKRKFQLFSIPIIPIRAGAV